MSKLHPHLIFLTLILLLAPHSHSQEIVRWDYGPPKKTFQFLFTPPAHPYMVNLREEFHLNQLVENLNNDLRKVEKVCDWVHKQIDHKGDAMPERNDPILILRKALAGEKFSCLEYAVVVAGCLTSLGIPTRVVELMPADVETRQNGPHHVVAEAFLPDRRKWVFVDAQWNAVAMLNDYPLSLTELKVVIDQKPEKLNFHNLPRDKIEIYREWLKPYLYYFYYFYDNRVHGTETTKRRSGGVYLVPLGKTPPRFFAGIPTRKAAYTSIIAEVYPYPQ